MLFQGQLLGKKKGAEKIRAWVDPPHPLIWAMPERKRFFSVDVFPFTILCPTDWSRQLFRLQQDYKCFLQIAEVSKGSKFAEEIREEQEEKKREEEVTFKQFFLFIHR